MSLPGTALSLRRILSAAALGAALAAIAFVAVTWTRFAVEGGTPGDPIAVLGALLPGTGVTFLWYGVFLLAVLFVVGSRPLWGLLKGVAVWLAYEGGLGRVRNRAPLVHGPERGPSSP